MTDSPCLHLEKLLPQLTPERARFVGLTVKQIPNNLELPDSSKAPSVEDFLMDLQNMGLKDYEIKLVEQRIIDGLHFDDIVGSGWTSRRSASYHYGLLLEKLRKLWPKR